MYQCTPHPVPEVHTKVLAGNAKRVVSLAGVVVGRQRVFGRGRLGNMVR